MSDDDFRSVAGAWTSGPLVDPNGILNVSLIGPPPPTAVGTAAFQGDALGALMSVCHISSEVVQVLGTAFMVHPGFALTAAHLFPNHPYEPEPTRGELLPNVLVGSLGDELRMWHIDRVWFVSHGDVVGLAVAPLFDLGAETDLNIFSLSARRPEQGELVQAFGLIPRFPEGTPRDELLFPRGEAPIIDGMASTGPVLEFYPTRGSMLPMPTIRCAFPSPSAMSGGPVFDSAGHVIGLLSSSMEIEGEWEAYVSLLWALMPVEIAAVWPPSLVGEPMMFGNLVNENWRVYFEEDGTLRYRYGDFPGVEQVITDLRGLQPRELRR